MIKVNRNRQSLNSSFDFNRVLEYTKRVEAFNDYLDDVDSETWRKFSNKELDALVDFGTSLEFLGKHITRLAEMEQDWRY